MKSVEVNVIGISPEIWLPLFYFYFKKNLKQIPMPIM
uniref:Uncharacterized protein n=1 Tax=Anguilla anguilla TaxID=7936 RepID=A0A0E9SHS5_ANGAN